MRGRLTSPRRLAATLLHPRTPQLVAARLRRLLQVASAGVVLVAVASTAACAASPVAITPSPTTTPTPAVPTGDGLLVLGALIPVTGASAALGPAEIAAVELAVRDINEAGGVAGVHVMVFQRDSGDAATSVAEASFDDLVAHQVDAVVGPSAADLAARLLPRATGARIPMVSPVVVGADLGADPAGWLFGVNGVPAADGGSEPSLEFARRLMSSDPGLTDLRLGPEAYDAAILIALAATAAGDDGGESIARSLSEVSSGGYACSSYGECAAALADGQDIDYAGVSGALDLDADGSASATGSSAVSG